MLGEIVHRQVAGTRRGAFTGEDTIHGVPSQERTVLAIGNVIDLHRLGELGIRSILIRGAGQTPGIGIQQVHTALGRFKIIQIGIASGIFILIVTRDQVGELRIEGDLAGLGQRQERELIDHVSQPLALRLIGGVQTPQGVLDRLASQGGLHGHRHLRHVHDRTAQGEVFRELVVQIQADHRLSLHVKGGLILQGDADRRTAGDDALIQDRDPS